MSADLKELKNRISALSDEELKTMLDSSPGVYRDDALNVARRVREARCIPLDSPDEYKVITAGGRENGPFDTSTIRQLYIDGLIERDTLIYCQKADQWRPLSLIFPLEDESSPVGRVAPMKDANNTTDPVVKDLTDQEKAEMDLDNRRLIADKGTTAPAPVGGALFQSTGYILDENQMKIAARVESYATKALICAVVGLFCLFFLEGFALYYAHRLKPRPLFLFNPLPVLEKFNIFDYDAIQYVSVSLDLIKLLTHAPFHNGELAIR
jgi:hypothetical protein